MNKKTILILSVLLAVLISASVLFLQKNNQPTEKSDLSGPLCSDSDNGKNIFVKGHATTKAGDNLVNAGETIHITEDNCAIKNGNKQAENEADYIQGFPSCEGSNCYVLEGYCSEYQETLIDQGEFIQCPNGCNDGACIPE